MSKVIQALGIVALSLLCIPAFADWQADATALDAGAGTGTSQTITSFKANIDQFQPPPPCVDTSKQSFQLGTPAKLSCAGSSSGSGGGGSFTEPIQQTQPSDNSGVFQ